MLQRSFLHESLGAEENTWEEPAMDQILVLPNMLGPVKPQQSLEPDPIPTVIVT